MKKSQNKASKKDANKGVSRHGIILISALAALILIVNIITASFSWFTPQDGKRMSYDTSYSIRSENCTYATHVGTFWTYDDTHKDHFTGYIDYHESSTTEDQYIASGDRAYFRTIIQNSPEVQYPSNISLYIADFPSNCSIGVQAPSNSFRSYTEDQQDLAIVRNAYVKKYVATDVDGPGRLYIDWFVVNNSNAQKKIELSKVYMVYN